jgi:hypothetical protein
MLASPLRLSADGRLAKAQWAANPSALTSPPAMHRCTTLSKRRLSVSLSRLHITWLRAPRLNVLNMTWRGSFRAADHTKRSARATVARRKLCYGLRCSSKACCATGRASLAALRFRPRSPPRLRTCLLRTVRPRHALDRPRHGQSRRRQPARRAALVACLDAAR